LICPDTGGYSYN